MSETITAKISIMPEAEKLLEEMLNKTNNGFSGGRLTRQDLVTWIIQYFEKNCFTDCIEKLRQDHFDQVAYLEAALRKVKEERKAGAEATDLSGLLAPLLNAPKLSSKRGRRTKQTDYELETNVGDQVSDNNTSNVKT